MKTTLLIIMAAALGAGCSTYSGTGTTSSSTGSSGGSATSPGQPPDQKKDEYVQYGDSNKLIRESDCVGAVVLGKCTGSTIGGQFDNKTCHGEVQFGKCIGVEM